MVPYSSRGNAQRRRIAGPGRDDIRKERRHGSKISPEFVDEPVKDFELAICPRHLSEFAQWRLKVIRYDGDIVGIAGRLRFLKRCQLPIRIRTSVIHVVAYK